MFHKVFDHSKLKEVTPRRMALKGYTGNMVTYARQTPQHVLETLPDVLRQGIEDDDHVAMMGKQARRGFLGRSVCGAYGSETERHFGELSKSIKENMYKASVLLTKHDKKSLQIGKLMRVDITSRGTEKNKQELEIARNQQKAFAEQALEHFETALELMKQLNEDIVDMHCGTKDKQCDVTKGKIAAVQDKREPVLEAMLQRIKQARDIKTQFSQKLNEIIKDMDALEESNDRRENAEQQEEQQVQRRQKAAKQETAEPTGEIAAVSEQTPGEAPQMSLLEQIQSKSKKLKPVEHKEVVGKSADSLMDRFENTANSMLDAIRARRSNVEPDNDDAPDEPNEWEDAQMVADNAARPRLAL